MTRYLVLDIEAVVDSSLWTPPADDPEAFAPVFAWRPICIGLALLEDGPLGADVKWIAPIKRADERALLAEFHATVCRLGRPTTIVTWNGRGFDLPVLMLRSLRYGFPAPWYYGVHRTMGDFGAVRSLGLDGIARLIGLPGKPRGADEVTGKNVATAYAAGRLPEIVSYCLADVVQTTFVWLRWRLLRGEVTAAWYRTTARQLLDACDNHERLGGLVASIDRRVLLLEEDAEVAA
jgi:hypothetical protein